MSQKKKIKPSQHKEKVPSKVILDICMLWGGRGVIAICWLIILVTKVNLWNLHAAYHASIGVHSVDWLMSASQ